MATTHSRAGRAVDNTPRPQPTRTDRSYRRPRSSFERHLNRAFLASAGTRARRANQAWRFPQAQFYRAMIHLEHGEWADAAGCFQEADVPELEKHIGDATTRRRQLIPEAGVTLESGRSSARPLLTFNPPSPRTPSPHDIPSHFHPP